MLVAGHCAEVTSLAVHPSLNEIVTGSDDKSLRIWDSSMKRMLGIKLLGQKVKACSFSGDGRLLAVANTEGIKVLEWP